MKIYNTQEMELGEIFPCGAPYDSFVTIVKSVQTFNTPLRPPWKKNFAGWNFERIYSYKG